ncbi:hypothetical protein [Stenotrophomonas sp. NPDC077461]|uniref:hypothetical protein n=1 Tax=Stenotrophomonas sp. NPDC077461 TaxID=3414698 RepID=UPI003C2C33D4
MEKTTTQEPDETGNALAALSPEIKSILVDCDLTAMAPSRCFECQLATVLQLSSPDGVNNSAVVHCGAMNRDIEVMVRRCTAFRPRA